MQTSISTDVVVVGLGPGGGQVAEDLASAGVRVVGVDAGLVGGECPYWGCIPSKRMIRAASALAEARRVSGLAGVATVIPDWEPVHAWIRDTATDDWDDTVAVERLEAKGGTFVRGRGRLDGTAAPSWSRRPTATRSSSRRTRAVVLATGSAPAVPPVDGLAGTPYWTNHEFVESAGAPVVDGRARRRCHRVRDRAGGRALRRRASRSSSTPTGCSPSRSPRPAPCWPRSSPPRGSTSAPVSPPGASSTPARASSSRSRTARRCAASGCSSRRVARSTSRRSAPTPWASTPGRAPSRSTTRCASLGPEGPVAGVFAIGDCAGQGAFTHVAVHHARVVTASLLHPSEPLASNPITAMPRVTFTDPEIGAVGLTVAQATARGLDVRTVSVPLASAATRGWIHGPGNDGLPLRRRVRRRAGRARRARDRPAARCSARSRSRCRAGSRWPTCAGWCGPTPRCTAGSSTSSRSSTPPRST